jgi:hypothetical protein
MLDITRCRLRNQRLSGERFARPEQVVSWLGAVQAQEYADAKWALALRSRHTSHAAIERSLTTGAILRTHILRPTWHFVAAADIRWMLALTGPRVSARMAPYNKRLELDAATFRRSERAIVRALRGGAELTRQELKSVLQRAGVRADSVQRLAHLVMQAEIDAVICSGARRGTQATYALLDERVPSTRTRTRDSALGELTRRYFTSHGPAQIADFVWWSGLTTSDARRGRQLIDGELEQDVVGGKTYWFGRATQRGSARKTAYLLGLYDEYLIAYKDRSAALDQSRWVRMVRDPFSAPIVVNGQAVGGWRRTITGDRIAIAVTPFGSLTRAETAAVENAAHAYASFFGLALELTGPTQRPQRTT